MSSPQLLVERSQNGDAAVLSARGELDMATSTTLANALGELLREEERGSAVVVDLSGLRFMDSTGMSVLLNAHRRFARQGRPLAVACPPGPVLRVFELTSMLETLGVRPTRDEALAAVDAA